MHQKKGGGRSAPTEWKGRRGEDGRAREGGARPKITPEDEQPPPRGGWASEGEHSMHNAEGVEEAAAGAPRRPRVRGGIMQAGRVRGRERRRPHYQTLHPFGNLNSWENNCGVTNPAEIECSETRTRIQKPEFGFANLNVRKPEYSDSQT